MLVHGQFAVQPAFAGRVEWLGNAAILIRDVTAADNGQYTVEVEVTEDTGGARKHVVVGLETSTVTVNVEGELG